MTSAAPRIHRAGLEHLNALSELFDQYRQFYQQPADLERARTFLAARLQANESIVFVAGLTGQCTGEPAGDLAGFTQLYPTFCSVAAAPYFVLYDLYVAPSARRKGVAEALLTQAAAFARAQGADRLELATAIDNTQAQALYEKLGWALDESFFHYALAL